MRWCGYDGGGDAGLELAPHLHTLQSSHAGRELSLGGPAGRFAHHCRYLCSPLPSVSPGWEEEEEGTTFFLTAPCNLKSREILEERRHQTGTSHSVPSRSGAEISFVVNEQDGRWWFVCQVFYQRHLTRTARCGNRL